ncbi:MAG TPA: hypothetical protein DER39_07040 [Porphyromonadaceae bacterium]|jgi:TonB family protein|nr:hypothetical protein [Porphyromonadaceae bacterium]
MKTNTILFALLSLILLANCKGNKSKKTLADEPLQHQSEEKVKLSVVIGPPPPGKTDRNDTSSVIEPDKVSASDEIYKVTDVDFLAAYPNGGWKAFSAYLQSVSYPREAKDNQVEGTLIVIFVVEKDGSVSNIEIERSANKLVDDEIVKALQNMPSWKPAQKSGLYVRSNYSFTLIYGQLK